MDTSFVLDVCVMYTMYTLQSIYKVPFLKPFTHPSFKTPIARIPLPPIPPPLPPLASSFNAALFTNYKFATNTNDTLKNNLKKLIKERKVRVADNEALGNYDDFETIRI